MVSVLSVLPSLKSRQLNFAIMKWSSEGHSRSLPPQRAPVQRAFNPTRALQGEQHASG